MVFQTFSPPSPSTPDFFFKYSQTYNIPIVSRKCRSFSAEERLQIRAQFPRGGETYEFFVSPKNEVKFDKNEFEDIVRLKGWLGNDAIDGYLGLAQLFSNAYNNSRTFVFNSNVYQHFVRPGLPKSWDATFKDLKSSIFDMDTVIVPQWHNESHYAITVLKPKDHEWYFCDSLYSSGRYKETSKNIKTLIEKLYEREELDPEQWNGYQQIVPQQGFEDGSSCGVYAVRFAVFAMFDMVIDFDWDDEKKGCFRYQIANDILNQRFSG